jgi:hypothetical protein
MILAIVTLVVLAALLTRPPRQPIGMSEMGAGGFLALAALLLMLGGLALSAGQEWGWAPLSFGVIMAVRTVRWWARY